MQSVKTVVCSMVALCSLLACSSSKNSSPMDAGGGASAGGASSSLELSPDAADVLTCGQLSLSAKVTGLSDDSVDFALSPEDAGSIDAHGLYSAPLSMPSSPRVSVTATAHADESLSATSELNLATAFPSSPVRVPGSTTGGAVADALGGVYAHGTVASGQRVYTVWRTGDGERKADLVTARSDDGGATWQKAVTALATTTPADAGGPPTLDCASLAVDAGDPDVLYAVTAVGSWGNSVADSVLPGAGAGGSVALLVSEDAGATFTTYVLKVTNGGTGICPDVVSPAPDTVVVSVPNPDNSDTGRDIGVWSDAQRGAGFADGNANAGELDYEANGETGALALLTPEHALVVNSGNASDASGAEWESPRLMTDAKGNVCITYTAQYQDDAHPNDLANAYVQCSDDAGKSFSDLLELDTQSKKDEHEPATAVGAMDAHGHVAVAWTADDGERWITLALSDDGGKSFDAPARVPTLVDDAAGLDGQAYTPSLGYDAAGILWLAYAPYDGDSNARLAIDKSCDDGQTWSGAVVLDGPLDDPKVQLTKPAIVLTDDAAPHVMAYESNYDDGDPLSYLALTPEN